MRRASALLFVASFKPCRPSDVSRYVLANRSTPLSSVAYIDAATHGYRAEKGGDTVV
jgi:hypothetical protein